MTDERFLAAEIDGHGLLFDAKLIIEILGECHFIQVPHASERLQGLFLWNGKAIPLIEIGGSWDLNTSVKHAPTAKRRRVLVVRALNELAGIAVDDATEVVTLSADQLKPVRVNPHPTAIFEVDDGQNVRSVIDLPALIADVLAKSQS